MSEMPKPPAQASGPTEDETVERLLRLAGPRGTAAADRVARMRAPVHAAWRQSVRQRNQRRWLMYGGAGLAAAATVLWAVNLDRPGRAPIVPAPASAVAAQLVSATGAVIMTGAPGTAAAVAGLRGGDSVPAGSSLRTADAARATLTLTGGGELRLDAGTVVTMLANREISLEQGGIYLDSGADRGAAPLVVRTPLGIVRDIGTRFETRLVGSDVRVRVRDGAVRVERGTALLDEAPAGTELTARADGRSDRREIARYGPVWDWVARAAPPFPVEGRTLASLLDWVAREGGWTVVFADPAVERASRVTIVHGSIEGLTPTEALDVVLPTCGLARHVDRDRVIVERPRGAEGGRP